MSRKKLIPMMTSPCNGLSVRLWPMLYRVGFLGAFLIASWLPAVWIDAILRQLVGRCLAALGALTRQADGGNSLSLTLKEGRTK
jgi:hypothetical protein